MLTVEQIKENPNLSDLTDSQRAAIAEMSKHDENTVIGEKTKEIHDSYDADIKGITGIDKPNGMKTYNHLKDVLKKYKSDAEKGGDTTALDAKITELETANAQLKAKGDSAELDKLTTELKDTKALYDIVLSEKDTLLNDYKGLKVKQQNDSILNDIDSYLTTKGVKYNQSIPSALLTETLKRRKADFLTNNTFEENDGMFVFRNKDGEIIRSKADNNAPSSAGQIFYDAITDLVTQTKNQGGSGASGNGTGSREATTITAARTRAEAYDFIGKQIMIDEGISKTDNRYQKRFNELANENNVSELPTE